MTAPIQVLEGLSLRSCILEDAAAVADLINLVDKHNGVPPEQSPENILREWQAPEWDITRFSRYVTDSEGKLIAYGEVYPRAPEYVNIWSFCRVHPDYWDRGIERFMLEWAEAEARELIAKAPAHARVTLKGGAVSTDKRQIQFYIDYGMEYNRSFYQMQIEFEGPVSAPDVPEGFTIRTMGEGIDPRAVHAAMDEAFEDHYGHLPMPYEQFEHFFLKNEKYDPAMWFFAMDGDQIAGLSLCDAISDEDPDMGWVADLAVRRPWRKRGLGNYLLRHSFVEMQKRGRKRAGLGVDASSLTGALRLYENAGMKAVREWVRYEKELRPGVELATITLSE